MKPGAFKRVDWDNELIETLRSRVEAEPRDLICLCVKKRANTNPYSAVSHK